MQRIRSTRRFWMAASVLTVVLAALMARATAAGQAGPAASRIGSFTGQVISASGAVAVGGTGSNPGHPVVSATVHLVPVTAIDVSTRMTASAIYAPPFTAEAYDEPLEDASRLSGKEFPQGTTNARGDFVIANVPDGRYFIHVTPGPNDTEHLPGGDHSRQSYAASDVRGQSMTIKLSSSPSPNARFVGSSLCLACHKDKQHWQRTAHKLGWTVPEAPAKMQDFSRHPEYFNAMASFPVVDDYRRGTRLELGDFDESRGDDKFKLRGFGDTRVPIETIYADVYLWKNASEGKYFITIVNRLNPQDPNSPAHLQIKLLYGGAVHDQRYIVAVPTKLGDRQGWYTVLRYNMTGRDNHLHRERRVWHDYKFYMWWAAGRDGKYGSSDHVLTAPPVNTNAVQTM